MPHASSSHSIRGSGFQQSAMSSGALGRGSYRSVVAGTRRTRLPTYYPSSLELIELRKAHQEVTRNFLVRDKVFDNKFPGCALANGLFKMVPNRRESFHSVEVMESIRRRTLWMQRVRQQKAINTAILRRCSKEMTPEQMEKRFSYTTADSAAYFHPEVFSGANSWPNFWQHPSQSHVVPKPKWRRVPELGGITRVVSPVADQPMDY